MATLQDDVDALARPEGRMVGTAGHERARQYLLGRLADLGLSPYRGTDFALPYHFARVQGCNLVGVRRGAAPAAPPLLLGAHYDSVIAAPCADDNAAAVAIVLAAAAGLGQATLPRDLIVALFDAEEPPYFKSTSMGSRRFFEDQAPHQGFQGAIVLDLVGHDVPVPPGLEPLAAAFAPLLFLTGAETHHHLPGVVRGVPRPAGLPVVAALTRHIGDLSDYYAFRLAGVPFLFLTCGRWAHYHQQTDTPDRLNYDKMARIAEYTTRLTGAVAATDLAHPLPTDPVDLEAPLLHEALGPALQPLLQRLGLGKVETRADLDAFAQRLQGYFRL